MALARLTALAVGALVVAGGLVACGGQDVTRAKLEHDVAATYRNLLARQDQLEGKPGPAELQLTARCLRAGARKSVGPGKDWRCTIIAAPTPEGPSLSVRYALSARANACYTATRADFKQQEIQTPTGERVKNPLYLFDGCLSA